MIELPFYIKDVFGYYTGLAMATLIGFAFGFVLERSGFGRAPILAAQFYFREMRVLKVMFSAIVTALLGSTILNGLGVLDFSVMQVPETFLWAQLVGGFILGVGFIISGYCPGTCIVSAGSGNIDGMVALLGVIIGSTVFGLFPQSWIAFSESGAMGMYRLPQLLGVSQAWIATGVAAMAVCAFVGAELVEGWVAKWRGVEPPASPRRLRSAAFAVFAVAAGLGLLTLLLPAPAGASKPVPGPGAVAQVDAVDLAQRLVEDPGSVLVLDLRDEAAYAQGKKAVPGARLWTAKDGAALLAQARADRMVLVYGAGDVAQADVPREILAASAPVRILRGGYAAFEATILAAPPVPKQPSAADLERYRLLSSLHAYFTGAAAAPPPAIQVAPPKPGGGGERKKGGGC